MDPRSASSPVPSSSSKMDTNQAVDQADDLKSKVESFNMDSAIVELNNILSEAAGMYHQLKKVRFGYLVQTCELFSRLDYPSIMIESCRKEVNQMVPKPKNIEKLNF